MSKRVTVIVEGREYIVEVGDLSESPIKATVNNRTYQVEAPRRDGPAASPVGVDEAATPAKPASVPRAPAPQGSAITAPMPGNIIEVRVRTGDSIKPGDVICILEAMKMNNVIYADKAGVIAAVKVVAGQTVDYGAPLVTFQ